MGLKLPGAGRRRKRSRAGSEGEAPARRARPRKASARPPADLRKRAGKAAKPLAAGLTEVLAIGREMVAIPAAMALTLADRLGRLVLAAWRLLRPVLVAALALARRALAVAERELTPARAVAAVAIAAAVLMAIAQFVDYREVRAGVPAYSDVALIAPPPQVSGTADTTGSAHLFLPLLVSVATIVIVVRSMLGHRRLARVLLFLGAVVVALSLLVDLPKGLDEGVVAIQFEGAEARLLGAFWVQLSSAAVIAICGPLLAFSLRPAGAGLRTRRRRSQGDRSSRRRLRIGRSRVQGASS